VVESGKVGHHLLCLNRMQVKETLFFIQIIFVGIVNIERAIL